MEKSKVLNFRKDGEFYYNRFEKNLDQGRYLDALVSLREALKLEPENYEFHLSIAELYTELGMYEESILTLHRVNERFGDPYGDVIYGLGCNFYGLIELDKSERCFVQYMQDYPDGEYFQDAAEFIAAIQEEMADAPLQEASEMITPQAAEQMDKGRLLIDLGRYEDAIQILKTALEENPSVTALQANLSLAYLCNCDYQEAAMVCRDILKREPNHIHANCNMALICRAQGDMEDSYLYLDRLSRTGSTHWEDLQKIAITLCDFKEYNKAYSFISEALTEQPYDKYSIFLAGCILSNAGKYSEAMKYFLDLLKLNPRDTIAAYYKEMVRSALDGGGAEVIGIAYQVPLNEAQRRVGEINKIIDQGIDVLRKQWQEDEQFKDLLRWGLTVQLLPAKRALLHMFGALFDGDAVDVLEHFLLDREQPDILKPDVFTLLRQNKCPQPYVACIAGKIVEVRVGLLEAEVNPSCRTMLNKIMDAAQHFELRDHLETVLLIFEKYLEALPKPPVIRAYESWAAAFLLKAVRHDGALDDQLVDKVLEYFGVELKSVLRCISKINSVIENKGAKHED